LLLIFTTPGYATDLDISSAYDISDSQAQDGDILVTSDQRGLIKASASYDQHLFGVLQSRSLLVFRKAEKEGTPVARYGTTQVNVTTLNGEIEEGAYITSSEIPGKGQKATLSGYVIGVSQTSFKEGDGEKMDYKPADSKEPNRTISSGKISVALKIEYAEISKSRTPFRFFDAFNTALFANMKDPSRFAEIFRYAAAGGIILASFVFGFFTFSRSVPKSIEAIGRNPLAEKTILFSVVLNIFFTVITATVGIIAAVFILRL